MFVCLLDYKHLFYGFHYGTLLTYSTSILLFGRCLILPVCMSLSILLCICGHAFSLKHISAWACHLELFPLVLFCHMLVQIFFCFSHLCSCHVPVPVHQWASALSTRSLWPQMSEQAAARQVYCAAGLCLASSHPSTSCSVMLTVIQSK